MQVSFTSRVKIISPSYISKIDANNIMFSKSGIARAPEQSIITLWANKRNAIMNKYTHTSVHRKQFNVEYFANFRTENKNQADRIMETLEKAQQPGAKNYTIRLQDDSHEFSISEY